MRFICTNYRLCIQQPKRFPLCWCGHVSNDAWLDSDQPASCMCSWHTFHFLQHFQNRLDALFVRLGNVEHVNTFSQDHLVQLWETRAVWSDHEVKQSKHLSHLTTLWRALRAALSTMSAVMFSSREDLLEAGRAASSWKWASRFFSSANVRGKRQHCRECHCSAGICLFKIIIIYILKQLALFRTTE